MSTAIIIYAYVYSTLLVCSGAGKIWLKLAGKYEETPKQVQIEEAITLPIAIFGCLSMYGYINNIAILAPVFWQAFTVLVAGHMVLCFWLPKQVWLKSEVSSRAYIIINIIGLSVGIPFYLILVVYAFHSFPNGVA